MEEGKIHFFGKGKFPLLKTQEFDLFWNAASFGEMEPETVRNYLSCIEQGCRHIYLLQARNGKESTENSWVVAPIKFGDYNAILAGFELLEAADAFDAHRRLSQSGGYFQGVWQWAGLLRRHR